jgi:hypothetical protein
MGEKKDNRENGESATAVRPPTKGGSAFGRYRWAAQIPARAPPLHRPSARGRVMGSSGKTHKEIPMNQMLSSTISLQRRNSATHLAINDFYYEAAHREGWTVSDYGRFKDGSPHIELQKLDNPKDGAAIFAEDREVWAHVVQQARTGSPLHIQALDLIDRRERLTIETAFGHW